MTVAYPDLKIAFVGGGTMAEAFIRGIIRQDIAAPQQLFASDPVVARQDYLSSEIGVHVTGDNAEAVQGAKVVIVAVKPQYLSAALASLMGSITPDMVVMSIVAGATIDTFQKSVGTSRIVRIMPNTPGQIGEGISIWLPTAEVSEDEQAMAAAIIGALGQEIRAHDEGDLDKATALSGSGPAYVFLFIEALIDAGVHMGFARPVAEALAIQTVKGSAAYCQESGLHPADLRNRVTSPGGTTAEALYTFEQGAFRGLVSKAVLAAYHRAQELGEK